MIIAGIHALGGAAQRKSVLHLIDTIWGHQFQQPDRTELDSQKSKVRWQHHVEWARLKLVDNQLLQGKAPRGLWVLTDKGRAAAHSLVASGE